MAVYLPIIMSAYVRNTPERLGDQQEVDRAFLDWFESRLATSERGALDELALDYFVALALYDRTWADVE